MNTSGAELTIVSVIGEASPTRRLRRLLAEHRLRVAVRGNGHSASAATRRCTPTRVVRDAVISELDGHGVYRQAGVVARRMKSSTGAVGALLSGDPCADVENTHAGFATGRVGVGAGTVPGGKPCARDEAHRG